MNVEKSAIHRPWRRSSIRYTVTLHRAPWWSSVYPRMPSVIIALILQFEYHRGESVNSQKKKESSPESVGRCNSARVDEGRNGWSPLSIKCARQVPYSEVGGEKRMLCETGSELLLLQRGQSTAKIMKRTRKTNISVSYTHLTLPTNREV